MPIETRGGNFPVILGFRSYSHPAVSAAVHKSQKWVISCNLIETHASISADTSRSIAMATNLFNHVRTRKEGSKRDLRKVELIEFWPTNPQYDGDQTAFYSKFKINQTFLNFLLSDGNELTPLWHIIHTGICLVGNLDANTQSQHKSCSPPPL